MHRLFPVRKDSSKIDQTQGFLLVIAGLAIVTYGLILSLAPSVRLRSGFEIIQTQHWVGIAAWGIFFSLLHHQSIRKLPQRDPYLLPIIALLSGFGLMTIYRLFPSLGIRQSIWLIVSSLAVIFGLYLPGFLSIVRRYKYIWLLLGLLLTGLTIFLGTNPMGGGSARWLQIFGIHFQPSEPLKLLLIAFLAGYFTDRISTSEKRLEDFFPTVLLIGISMLLLIFQGDLGTAIILLLIYMAMLFTAQGNKSVLILTPLFLLLAGVTGYFLMDLVRSRVDTWLNPFGDPAGASYQIIQSLVAIAEGSLIGTGPGLGSPGLIPVSVSDFIFSAIAEELGFMGVTMILLVFIFLLYRGTLIALQSKNSFNRYLSLGIVFYFGIQTILIIGGNIGLLPLTGVTLPFISYGGSSLLVSFLGLLFLLKTSNHVEPNDDEKQAYQPRFVLIGSLLILGLVTEIIATSLISFWFSPSLINRPENPRWIIYDRFVARGEILDRNNEAIKTNSGEIGSYRRASNHIPLYPVIGYTHPMFGQTGIEASMYPYLRGKVGHPFITQFWQKLLYNQPPQGLDIRLALDLDLQKTADEVLSEYAGAVIVMNANTGEIIAMASHPYFDATDLQSTWQDLINDKRVPLINRPTQGRYSPGTTLSPFIITAQPNILQILPDPSALSDDELANLACALPPEHPLTWTGAIASGCQSVQLILAESIGVNRLLETYQNFGFFTQPALHLPVAEASVPDQTDPTSFYLGEADFLVSPLQMVMATSALTNFGLLPGPRMVNAYQSPEGEWIILPKLQANQNILEANTTNQVTQLLKMDDLPIWQLVSVAYAENDQPVTWFIAGTTIEWKGQPFAAVVLLEDNAPEQAKLIGQMLIEQVIRFSNPSP